MSGLEILLAFALGAGFGVGAAWAWVEQRAQRKFDRALRRLRCVGAGAEAQERLRAEFLADCG